MGNFATGEEAFTAGTMVEAEGVGMGAAGLDAFATLAAFLVPVAPTRLAAADLVDFAATVDGRGGGGGEALTLDLGAEVGELGLPALVEGLLAEVELRDVVVRFWGTRFFSGFITTGGTGFDARG
ncbi:MAG: hypothetical protein IT581_10870 [Verrucomicrobiales bacterium]|nr:hypothetical protein [Verrucomicrobiales bacterium]